MTAGMLFGLLVLANLADLWTTRHALKVKGAYENNMFFGRRPTLLRLVVIKAAFLGLVAFLLWPTWDKPLPPIGVAIGIAVVAVTLWIAWWNWKLTR